MQHTQSHTWTTSPKAQVRRAQQGGCEFSHPDQLPLSISVKKTGWLCRKIVVTTVEPVWYRDAVSYVEIPAGFTCDLASVPRPLWCVASPYDLAYEGLVHDALYREQRVTRRYADFMLLMLIEKRGVPMYVRYPVWLAVRLFGGKAWENNKRRLSRDAK